MLFLGKAWECYDTESILRFRNVEPANFLAAFFHDTLIFSSWQAQLLEAMLSYRYPFIREAYDIMRWVRPAETSNTRGDLGVEFMPLKEICEDMIRCMYDLGRISAKQAGKLARIPTHSTR